MRCYMLGNTNVLRVGLANMYRKIGLALIMMEGSLAAHSASRRRPGKQGK